MPTQWFYSHCGEKVIGPVSSRELKTLAASGELLPTDRVRKHRMVQPVRASRIKGLFAPPSADEACVVQLSSRRAIESPTE